jgi:hypothetical protein
MGYYEVITGFLLLHHQHLIFFRVEVVPMRFYRLSYRFQRPRVSLLDSRSKSILVDWHIS